MQEGSPEQSSGFLRPLIAELRYNAGAAGPALLLDASVLVVCAALFLLCDNVLIGTISDTFPGSPASYLLSCHAIDAIGGCAFMAYTNLLLDLVKPDMRFKRIATTLFYMLFCGVFWEAIALSFVPGNARGLRLDAPGDAKGHEEDAQEHECLGGGLEGHLRRGLLSSQLMKATAE